MKIEFEVVEPDEGSSFRLLHTKSKAEDYLWSYHYHPEYELVCVIKGNGTRHVGKHFSSYDNGDLVLIGPNLPHSGFGLNSHDLHEEIVVQVREEVLKDLVMNRPEMHELTAMLAESKYGLHFKGDIKEKVTKKLHRLLKLSPVERLFELVSILHFLAVSKDYTLLNPTPNLLHIQKNNSRLQHIFTYVEQHFHEEVDIQKVAAVANLSVPSFCNYFKKIMNCTFTDFVNRYRVQRACVLLQQEKSISEICFEVGYNNVVYFNKVFKTITHKTPSAYKKDKLLTQQTN